MNTKKAIIIAAIVTAIPCICVSFSLGFLAGYSVCRQAGKQDREGVNIQHMLNTKKGPMLKESPDINQTCKKTIFNPNTDAHAHGVI